MSTTRVANEIAAAIGREPRTGTKAHATWTRRAIRYCTTSAATIREINADNDAFRNVAFAEAAELDLYAATLAPEQDIEQRIRTTYTALAATPHGWVSLGRLRGALADVPRAAMDEGLRRLDLVHGVFLVPEPNKKTLSDAERAAAIRIGGEDKHLIAIED